MLMYEGRLLHPEGITFRFRGSADDEMMVRIGDQVVFGDSFVQSKTGTAGDFSKVWKSSDQQTGNYFLGNNTATVGDWITLEAEVPVDIQILAAEIPGGVFSAMLLIEEEGVDYPKNKQGGPILPVFKMDALSRNLLDQICVGLPENEAALEGGPVFGNHTAENIMNDAGAGGVRMLDESSGSGLRIWTGDNEQVLEARYEGVSGSVVLLADVSGKQRRIPIKRLSEEDQLYIDLIYNLEHKVSFEGHKMEQKRNLKNSIQTDAKPRHQYIFKATAEQVRAANKKHELVGEFYVFAKELHGDAYALIVRERQEFASLINSKSSRRIITDPIEINDHVYGNLSIDEEEFVYLYLIVNFNRIRNNSAR